MRSGPGRLTALAILALAATSSPCLAASLSVVPSAPTGYWAGTRLALAAERAPSGALRIRVDGTVAVKDAARVSIVMVGCAAGTDDLSSYSWSPEHHPAGRQAVPAWPLHLQDGSRRELSVRGKQRVSFSETIAYGFSRAEPRWTDCVSLVLARVTKDGRDILPAFKGVGSTLYVSVTLQDGRHIECGSMPAFCPAVRPSEFVVPVLPDFPPAPGYPGAPGALPSPPDYPYQA